MFAFNFLFFLLGCAILGLGLWLKIEKGDYARISTYNFVTAANIAIAAGAIVLIVAFLGCCGAIKEIKVMLLAFFILLVLIFILEITAGSLAYVKRNELEDKLHADFNVSIIEKYEQPGEEAITKSIDKFQGVFQCCGFSNFMDWKYSKYYDDTGNLPKSCCRDANSKECPKSLKQEDYFLIGCFPEVKEFLKDNLLYIGACGIVFALVQVLGMIFSMMLYCSIDSNGGTYA